MVSILLACCQYRLFCRFACKERRHLAYEATVEECGCYMLSAHAEIAGFSEVLTPRDCIHRLLGLVDSVTVIVGERNVCQVYGRHCIVPSRQARTYRSGC